MNKHYLTLELDKVLQMLKNETSCDDAAELALEVKPSTDFGDVCRMLNQTEDAASLLERFGAPSFGGLVNVNNALARAVARNRSNAPLNPCSLRLAQSLQRRQHFA